MTSPIRNIETTKSSQKESSYLAELEQFSSDIIPILLNFGEQVLKIGIIVAFNILAVTVHNHIITHYYFHDNGPAPNILSGAVINPHDESTLHFGNS